MISFPEMHTETLRVLRPNDTAFNVASIYIFQWLLIFRYAILRRYGGAYFDSDVISVKAADMLFNHDLSVFCEMSTSSLPFWSDCLNNGVISTGSKDSSIFQTMLGELLSQVLITYGTLRRHPTSITER